MTGLTKSMRKMNDRQLQMIAEALDAEVDRRARRQIPRGYQRTPYMDDIVRGRRMAPRPDTRIQYSLAA